MLESITRTIHNGDNPIFRVRQRFSRYVLICSITGTFSFLLALALLHTGFQPFLTLVISVLISGVINYAALELWGFPHRRGRLSWKRMWQNALVGTGGFGVRYAVLTAALMTLHFPEPFTKFVPLALAYLASFAFGYFVRSRLVFKNSPTSRRYK